MVNLHNIVRGAINAVNPDQPVTIKRFIGQTHAPGGLFVTEYETIETTAQVQPIRSNDIQFIENYVASGSYRNFYLNGDFSGLNRRDETGGDFILWNNRKWFIDSEPEPWNTAGWTLVRGCQQL